MKKLGYLLVGTGVLILFLLFTFAMSYWGCVLAKDTDYLGAWWYMVKLLGSIILVAGSGFLLLAKGLDLINN